MTSTGHGTWSRFVRLAAPFFTSSERRRALLLLGCLLALLLAMSGLNVVNSYVGRYFMTAVAKGDPDGYRTFALAYLAVFAASTAVGGFSRLAELVLGLRWRDWLTRRFLGEFLAGKAYARLKDQEEIDNPDQRISEDVKTFTTDTLSFFILVLNSAISVLAFSGVLWSITPWLFLAAVAYPALGTAGTVLLGRRLVGLNNLQLRKEADFRYELVRVRERAAAVARASREEAHRGPLLDRLGKLIENYRAIIRLLFRLKLFSGGYNYLTQLIPVLIVAPLYFRREVEFGVVTQSAMAFSQVFNGFSLIVEQFQDLSTFAAVVGRLGALREALEGPGEGGTARPAEVRPAGLGGSLLPGRPAR